MDVPHTSTKARLARALVEVVVHAIGEGDTREARIALEALERLAGVPVSGDLAGVVDLTRERQRRGGAS